MTKSGVARALKTGGASRQVSTPKTLSINDVVIGTDVLELVSSAMYVDPLTIYREYVQNAADAIDDARSRNLLRADEPGRVQIAVDASSRTIRIRDNGTGISWSQFGRKLAALGASAKRGTSARGFRGVGRLAGLGYAQELVFRSRRSGEERVSELRWDCRKLKAALRAPKPNVGVAELISDIVTLERLDAEEFPERFFEVELRGAVRLRSDRLMNSAVIAEYLSQIAPVPFSPDFRFGPEIAAALGPLVQLGNLDIRIDGVDGPIYRPHRNELALDDKRSVPFESLTVSEVPGVDGEVAAICWILHHNYEGAVPSGTHIKGLRLRSGNIQVGDHSLLEELFPEPRFNAWSVGEVHVIDRRIVPNGRRDHFESNAHFHNLLNHLAPTARDIARRCRTSSVKRKWLREFELHRKSVREAIDVIRQGSVGHAERRRIALSVEQTLLQMDKIAEKDLSATENLQLSREVVADLRTAVGEAMRDEVAVLSPLMRLPKAQRKKYEHFFELIYQCSVNKVAAKALIDRILLRLE